MINVTILIFKLNYRSDWKEGLIYRYRKILKIVKFAIRNLRMLLKRIERYIHTYTRRRHNLFHAQQMSIFVVWFMKSDFRLS